MKPVVISGSNEKILAGKIICIGQNYAEHAKEINFEVQKSPLFFLKPSSSIINNGEKIVLPDISNNIHHEVELTVLIGKEGKNVPHENALEYIAGYGVGLDMTLRDLQLEAKKKGFPWTLAKGFDTAAPLSEFVPSAGIGDPNSLYVQLKVNGTLRQSSATVKMIFSVQTLIAHISKYITLERGDVIFTGTPEGVSRVEHGDKLEAALLDSNKNTLAALSVSIQ